jgi:hypothetical protein
MGIERVTDDMAYPAKTIVSDFYDGNCFKACLLAGAGDAVARFAGAELAIHFGLEGLAHGLDHMSKGRLTGKIHVTEKVFGKVALAHGFYTLSRDVRAATGICEQACVVRR